MVMISNFMLSIVNEFNVYRSTGEIYSHLHRHSRKALFLSKAVSRWKQSLVSLWQKGVSPATTCFDICLVDPSLQAHWFFSGETSQHTVRLLSAMLGHHGEEVTSEVQLVTTMTSTSCDESEKYSFVHIPLPTTVTLQVQPISLSSPLVSTDHSTQACYAPMPGQQGLGSSLLTQGSLVQCQPWATLCQQCPNPWVSNPSAATARFVGLGGLCCYLLLSAFLTSLSNPTQNQPHFPPWDMMCFAS